MDSKESASNLLMTALTASKTAAFEYIVANDPRPNKEQSITYKEIVKKLKSGDYCEARKAYIKRRGPGYKAL